MATLPALEVVILALRTLPSTIWETEASAVRGSGGGLFFRHKRFGGGGNECVDFLVIIAVQSTKQITSEEFAAGLLID